MSGRLLVFLLGLSCLAPAWARDDRPQRMQPTREMQELRRERMRESRDEFRAMREQLREQSPRDGAGARRDFREEDAQGPRGPALRRLEPEERERLRRTMREAAREHYSR